jgi:hypothetical protein
MHSPDLLTDQELYDLIGEVYLDVLTVEDWPFLRVEQTVTLVDGQADYDLTSPMRMVTSAVVSDGERLYPVLPSEMERDPADDDGEPVAYARLDENTIRVYPTPDASGTVTMVGWKQPTLLTASGDTPVFEADFHSLLAYEAAARLLIAEGDDSKRAEGYQREAGAKVEAMRQRYLRLHDSGMVVMGGRRRRRFRVGL